MVGEIILTATPNLNNLRYSSFHKKGIHHGVPKVTSCMLLSGVCQTHQLFVKWEKNGGVMDYEQFFSSRISNLWHVAAFERGSGGQGWGEGKGERVLHSLFSHFCTCHTSFWDSRVGRGSLPMMPGPSLNESK